MLVICCVLDTYVCRPIRGQPILQAPRHLTGSEEAKAEVTASPRRFRPA